MTPHALIESLKYKWKAYSRHGIHSPFVYDFIEHVLLDKGPIAREYIVRVPHLSLTYENLVSRIAAYYKYTSILSLPVADGTPAPQHADLLLIEGATPLQLEPILKQCYHLITNESAVIIMDIHKTKAHSLAWKKICALDQVRMSIDVYGIGILFFKQEFKVRQHFVLKY